MNSAESLPELSIVIPVFREAATIAEVLRIIETHVAAVTKDYEIIVVDDGSPDDTWDSICRFAPQSPSLRAIRLSRNFGKEYAVAAGLEAAKGQAAIVMDSDLQHPPALIPKLVERWRSGAADIVDAVKINRGQESPIYKLFASGFYRILHALSGIDLANASDFKLIDRRVLDAWLRLRERNLFFRGMVTWLGFRRASVPFEVPNRLSGSSQWSFVSLVKLALTAVTAFSSKLLQLVTVFGSLFFLAALLFGIYALFLWVSGHAVAGFTTVILLQLIIGSLIMVSLGLIGLYLSRLYDEVKARPRYLIADALRHGSQKEKKPADYGAQGIQFKNTSPPPSRNISVIDTQIAATEKPRSCGFCSRESLYVLMGIFLWLIFTYLPLIQTDFLFSDDLIFFTFPKGFLATGVCFARARPIQGLIIDFLNTSVIAAAGLKRLVPLSGLILLGWSLYVWFRMNGLRLLTAASLALSVCCLSSFHRTLSYLVLTSSVWGSFFSCLAVILFWSGSDGGRERKIQYIRICLASLFMFLALSCYQFGAMFCWAALIVPVYVSNSSQWRHARKRIFAFGLMMGCALTAYLFIYKFLMVVCLGTQQLSARARFVINPHLLIDKITWFFSIIVNYAFIEMIKPLIDPGLPSARHLISICLAISAAGIFMHILHNNFVSRLNNASQKLAFLLCLLPLCYLPMLIIEENGGDPTYLTALQSAILIIVCLGIQELLKAIPKDAIRVKIEIGIMAVVCCLFTLTTNQNVLRTYVLPNHSEYRYVKSMIIKEDITKVSRIHIIGSLNFSDVLSYSEALVHGVLTEVAPNAHPAITSSAVAAPSVIHPEILSEYKEAADYYQFNPTQKYFNLKPTLSAEEKAKLDSYFADRALSLAKQPGVLIIDLAKIAPR